MIKNLTITRLQIGKKKVSIYFNDEKLDISLNTYVEFTLFKGKTLTEKEYKEIKYRDSLDKYISYSLKTLSSSHLTEKAYIDKLNNKGANQKQINYLVKEMKRYSLIDDDEFINDYLENTKYKRIGEKRIKDELYKKGISKDKIENLKFDNELEIAIGNIPNLEKKYASLNYEAKKKHIYDNLLRLGFSYEISEQALSHIKEKDDKAELIALSKDTLKAINKYKAKFKDRELKEKVINYLMSKGYKYKDIINNKEINKL